MSKTIKTDARHLVLNTSSSVPFPKQVIGDLELGEDARFSKGYHPLRSLATPETNTAPTFVHP